VIDVPRFNSIVNPLAQMLEPEGFIQHRLTWYLQQEETVLVVNLEQSAWGKQFDIGLGISIRELSEAARPLARHCHVRDGLTRLIWKASGGQAFTKSLVKEGRTSDSAFSKTRSKEQGSTASFSRINPLQPKRLRRIIDETYRAMNLDDQSVSDRKRASVVKRHMTDLGLPFLRKCDSLEKIRNSIRNGELNGSLVQKIVYARCGVPFED
jgi:hypothetical protein